MHVSVKETRPLHLTEINIRVHGPENPPASSQEVQYRNITRGHTLLNRTPTHLVRPLRYSLAVAFVNGGVGALAEHILLYVGLLSTEW